MFYKNRIIIFDGDASDRALLVLALKSTAPDSEILEASSVLETARLLGAGPVDALIADPGPAFGELSELVQDARRRNPDCLWWLFTADPERPSRRDCIGRGVDARAVKSSAGFLALPGAVVERCLTTRALGTRTTPHLTHGLSGALATPGCLVNRFGAAVALNPELERLLDRPRYELLGQPFETVLRDATSQQEWRRHAAGPGEPWNLVAAVTADEGKERWVAASAVPVHGTELWAVSVFDATRLVDTTAPAQPATDPELDSMMYAVAHDLQAPLNSLASHARWLSGATADSAAEIRGAVDDVDALVTRMQQMLDAMLAVAAVRASDRPAQFVSLDSVVADAIANLRSEIDETGATIECQPLPALRVHRHQMVQVFQNLIANGLKFRSSRIPRVLIGSERSDDRLLITVEDNGIGFDARDAGRIFGMFRRLHGEREYPGLGVGLAICRQIVRAHGGEISVDSTPGRGSCFKIEFRGEALREAIGAGPP